MTPERAKRLVEAFDNIESLLDAADFTESTIQLCHGRLSKLSEEYMAGRRKKTVTIPPTVTGDVPPAPLVGQPNRDELLAQWRNVSRQLAKVKEEEHTLRQQLVAMCFDANKLEGTETIDLGYGGWTLRAVKEINYTATNKDGQTVAMLTILQAIDPGLTAELIRWQPEVAKRAYRAAFALTEAEPTGQLKAALAAAITVKPGLPQLELVPPKQLDVLPEQTYVVETMPE